LDEPVTLRRQTPWIAGGVALVVAAAGAGFAGWRAHRESAQDDEARRAAQAFVSAWQTGHLADIGWSSSDGTAMQAEYAAVVAGMGSVKPTVRLDGVTRSGQRAEAAIAASWVLGRQNWTYSYPVRLVERSGRWLVDPDGVSGASIFAPITRDARLSLTRTQAPRGTITGKGNTQIVGPGRVVDVGIEPARVVDPSGLVADVARITGVDRATLAKALAAASPHAFVPVITLRQADYDQAKDKLQPLKGTVFRAREQSLAVNRDFARALIGTVGPVTAEIVSASDNRYRAGDFAGVSGLQRQYDSQLSGQASYMVMEVPKDKTKEQTGPTLFTTGVQAGQNLSTTLDPKVQIAADNALKSITVPGAIVAIDVRSGAVLAVANTPSSGLNRAMVGRYPPGSTLKVATTLALLKGGVRPTTKVSCPPTATVGGRKFRNYEHEAFSGAVPFSTDFKDSCNTAFVGLSKRLQPDDLHDAALQLGLGVDWTAALGASPQTFAGSIPTTTGAVDQAAAAFGQGRNLVSPLSMAVLAGSVARGKFLAPSLVLSPAPAGSAAAAPTAPPAPAAKDIATLHSLMRLVVTSGTAAGKFTGLSGGPVFAKTGTAEFGSGSPPTTHAWLIGWQGDVAFAVFVEEGKSGGSVAGPVARDFLRRLH
jgi:cell division protein FtsI/penicillin-binding protein 2